jgi:hypothetical protein
MKHGRKVYGYFKTEKLAENHVANAKKQEKTYEGVDFNYKIVKRNRNKSGLKPWFAYRLIKKD